MPLLIVIALMALPFVEVWLMVVVGQQIGAAWTVLALFGLSATGAVVLRSAGIRAHRAVEEAMRTGKSLQNGPLEMLMVMVGGILLLVPGFLTGLLGAVVALPVTRPALRWAFTAWAERRMARMRATMNAESAVPGRQEATGPGHTNGAPGSGRVVRGRVVSEDESSATGDDS
ncbi:FxsA family protein [Haloactinospora alba]|nr:FxsA family protein [Haloactinospora alba]